MICVAKSKCRGAASVDDDDSARHSAVDWGPGVLQNADMSIDTTIPSDVMARMQRAADRASTGTRNREELDEAFADSLRESLRQRIGTISVAVELIRDARNQ